MAPANAPSVANLASTVTNAANQPDLRGNLMPVRSEIDIDGCHVDGTTPTGLRGSFIRNGPNPAFEPLGSYHMFDGDGMLHGITFGDDGVSYLNRWIRSRGSGCRARSRRRRLPRPGRGDELPDPKLTGDADR
jgi:carotenoid cleavage dioxygenase-like enzyme